MEEQKEYWEILEDLGEGALRLLLDMEMVLENFHFPNISQYQRLISEKYQGKFKNRMETLANIKTPIGSESFHNYFLSAYSHLNQSFEIFSYTLSPKDYIYGIHLSHQELCRAKHCFYNIRSQIRALRDYFYEDKDKNIRLSGNPDKQGLLFIEESKNRSRYTLYAPEYYDPARTWPLAINLHGGGGDDRDFIWLWLREAKRKGYILVSPKSSDWTWQLKDIKPVFTLIREIQDTYRINEKKILLTGVSDGGTFTYELGLRGYNLFTALAPISGKFYLPWADFKKASHLAVYILHGTKDPIIPVFYARKAKETFEAHQYRLVYQELPEWGHAIPFSKIENISNWFDKIQVDSS